MTYNALSSESHEIIRASGELCSRISAIRECIRSLEQSLSVHDAIMECASDSRANLAALSEAIYFSREALSGLRRINEVMECIGGEVSGLKWEISRTMSQGLA